MKALPLLGLFAAGAMLLGSNTSKPISIKKTYKNLDDSAKKANEEAILKYYTDDPLYIKDIPDIMSLLTDSLKQEIVDKNIFVYLPLDKALFLFDATEIILAEKYKDQKGIAENTKKIDDVTQDVLVKFAHDVYWKERLIPYMHGSPFQKVWSSVNRLVEIAAENREQKGI